MSEIQKYPRTQHIGGSRLQSGDEDVRSVPFSEIAGRHVVVEEKLDGANCGILPHYLLEFDVLDTRDAVFLDTPHRAELLAGLPLPPVKVLFAGALREFRELTSLVGPSCFIRDGHMERLRSVCERLGLDADRAMRETDGRT